MRDNSFAFIGFNKKTTVQQRAMMDQQVFFHCAHNTITLMIMSVTHIAVNLIKSNYK